MIFTPRDMKQIGMGQEEGKETTLTKGIGDFINDISGASSTNDFNASEAEKQRQWEERMSNTAYQRAMEDIKKAGLNPSLLYGSGASPANTPSGYAAKGHNGAGVMMSLVSSAVSLAIGMKGTPKFNAAANNALNIMEKSKKYSVNIDKLNKTFAKLGWNELNL